MFSNTDFLYIRLNLNFTFMIDFTSCIRKLTLLVILFMSVHIGYAENPVVRAKFEGFECGMGIGVKGKVDFPQIGFEKRTTERGFSKVSKSV